VQPPIAADMVDPFLKIPISPPATKRIVYFFFIMVFNLPDNTSMDGITPALPLWVPLQFFPKRH
jgi:hypothetical protein